MTWKSHCVVNASVTLALTGRYEVALAAMSTAALPDQIERYLPLGRHRGASHWIMLWLSLIIMVPMYLQPRIIDALGTFARLHGHARHQVAQALAATFFGFALGPMLHVLLDGCSHAGVPVAPFTRQRLKLCLYKTYSRRSPWNVSELIFLGTIFIACAYAGRIRHLF